jgi:hypothetical protein
MSVSKRAMQQFNMQRLNLKELHKVEVKKEKGKVKLAL